MKHLLVLIVIAASFGLNACKKPPVPENKDDNNKEETPSEYVGTWSYNKIIMSNGSLKAQNQSVGTFNGTGKDIVGSIEVSENPNVFSAELEYTAALNITVFGQTQQTDFPVEKRTLTGTWKVVNGKIELTADDSTPITVISSTSSEIVFTGAFTEKVTYGQFSLDAVSDVEFTVVK